VKTPKVPGHRLIATPGLPGIGRSATLYTAVCECGFHVQLWSDRLSVARSKHRAHLRTLKEAK
jgi:protein-tyrosine phosphatase